MTNATVRGSRLGRSLALSLGVFAGIGLLLTCHPDAAAKQPRSVESSKPANGASGGYIPQQVRKINEEIAAQWKANNLTPSKQCSDHEFIRRVSLDIIGRIATPAEIKQFMNDPPPTRRSMLIDRLLQSEEYARNWASIWTVWLLTRSAPTAYHDQMHLWLEEQFSQQKCAFDKVVTELLTATGKNSENGAVNYVLAHVGMPNPPDKVATEGQFDMVPITSRTTRLFLGLQTQCTQCHDHPFNPQWKQQHFWGINAFFRQVERRGVPVMQRNLPAAQLTLLDNKSWNDDSVVFFEKRNGVVLPTKPTFVEGKDRRMVPKPGVSRRQQLSEYIIKSDYFPKAFVNRTWAHFFGRGMNNPGAIDDFGEHNPLTHPELLEYLAKEFKDYQYNPRELIKWICNCEAYGLSTVANKTNDKPDAEPFFSRMILKAMSPEQLFESMMAATQAESAETKENKKKLRESWMRNLIVNFGDDEGNEVTFNGTVVQALMLMNGKEINSAISNKEKGTVAVAMMRKGANQKTIMEDLFLTALNRPPTSKEVTAIAKEINMIRTGATRAREPVLALWQDLFWGLLNSNEFILNH